MKATLAAGGLRQRSDRRIDDTADAVMLAAACADDPAAMAALARHGRRSEPRRAMKWLAASFQNPRSQCSRRVAKHTGDDGGADWAVDAAARFASALDDARRSMSTES